MDLCIPPQLNPKNPPKCHEYLSLTLCLTFSLLIFVSIKSRKYLCCGWLDQDLYHELFSNHGLHSVVRLIHLLIIKNKLFERKSYRERKRGRRERDGGLLVLSLLHECRVPGAWVVFCCFLRYISGVTRTETCTHILCQQHRWQLEPLPHSKVNYI